MKLNGIVEGIFTAKINELNASLSDWEILFLSESNKLEGENSAFALMDSMLAWNYAKKSKSSKVRHDCIKNIHFLLMRNLNREIAGIYREIPVMVGGREDTCPPEEIFLAMEKWCEEFSSPKGSPEEVRREHVKFLKIHPFVDGNGRTARILMNVQNLSSGYQPIIFLAQEPPKGVESYYDWFN